MKLEPAVRKETGYIALCVAVLSLFMQAVFLIIGKWDIPVLLGGLLSGFFAVLNFFLMGLTVQKAVTKEQKDAASLIKLSQMLRLLMQMIPAVLGATLPCFNLWAALIPLLFPRIAIAFRPLFPGFTKGDFPQSDQ